MKTTHLDKVVHIDPIHIFGKKKTRSEFLTVPAGGGNIASPRSGLEGAERHPAETPHLGLVGDVWQMAPCMPSCQHPTQFQLASTYAAYSENSFQQFCFPQLESTKRYGSPRPGYVRQLTKAQRNASNRSTAYLNL